MARLQIHLSVPDEDTLRELDAKAKAAGLSRSAYLLERALAPDDEVRRLRGDLRQVALQLDEIARSALEGASR